MDTIWVERQQQRSAKRDGDHRSPFQRDKARVMHSAAFRRLQAKTQVLGIGISDFYRTRLTHSLEAAQIGTGICAQLCVKSPDISQHLQLDEHLIETLCLAHDIGHPPFGHGGEVALHYMMRKHGGFEGNGQTFRIVTKLESYTQANGMNLARRTLLGLVKYPNTIDRLNNPSQEQILQQTAAEKVSMWHPPKGLFSCDQDAYDWLISPLSDSDKLTFSSHDSNQNAHYRTRYKSVDCSIMELADDIAYGIHDLEDAVVMGLVKAQRFEQEVTQEILALNVPWLSDNILKLHAQIFDDRPYLRKNAIGALVNCFITAIGLVKQHQFDADILDYKAAMPAEFEAALELFKNYIFTHVIRMPELQLIEFKGQRIVRELFESFASEPMRLLPINTRERWQKAPNENAQMRVIADYISGMTDEHANRLYSHLFLPKSSWANDALHP